MEQKIAMMLVSLLMKGPNHARALAKSLGINHMTAMRALKSLVDENILDYSVMGRNKVFHLKSTVEARDAILMAELHRLDLILEQYPSLRRIVAQILDDERVQLAVLFGSFAKGTAKKDSDIDLYVETVDPVVKKDLMRLSSKLSVKVGGYDRESPLIKEIEKDHVIIKGVEIFYRYQKLLKGVQEVS